MPQEPSFRDAVRAPVADRGQDQDQVGDKESGSDAWSPQERLKRARSAVDAVLHETDRNLCAPVDQVRDYAIFTIGLDGRALSWNQGVERVLGWSEEEFIGLDTQATYTEEDIGRGVLERELQESRDMGEASNDRWMCRKTGERFWANGICTALYDHNDHHIGYTKVMRDMTDAKATEDRLRETDKMQVVGRLAGGVAHEVNNMMTVILGFADLLSREHRPGDVESLYASEIRHAAERATHVTHQLLAYSKRQVLKLETFDLNDTLRHITGVLRRILGEDNELRTNLSSEPAVVMADRGQLEQVLVNLTLNARDAMPHGGRVVLRTDLADIDEGFARRSPEAGMNPGRYVMLSVTDTGVGMDALMQGRIFEPFFTTKRQDKATGLGLSTVQGIVQQSGGFVRVESQVGRGTTFHLYLPQHSVPTKTQTETGAPVGLSEALAEATILVVEDEPMLLRVAVLILEREGYKVLEASNGPMAVAILTTHWGALDLIITDMVMPGMSGRELAEYASRQRSGLKVLYMSGYTDDEAVQQGFMLSGDSFLQKPFTSLQLRQAVSELLRPRAVA